MSGSGMTLRVAVDGRVLVMKPTGIGRYTRSLMETLARLKGEAFRPVFFTHDRILDQSFWPGQLEQRMVRFPGPMLIRPVWDEFLLPRAIRREGPFDLYFSPLSVVPGGLNVPSVATIHDLAFYRDPGVQPWKYRRYWKRAIRGSVRHAAKLIAVSESTRHDLQQFFPGSEAKTQVVHEAPAPIFHHPIEEGRNAFSTLGRYFLAVGTLEPRKNYPFLIEVFQRLLRRPGCDELKVVVAGGPGWCSEEVEALMERGGTFLVRLDYVEYHDLPELYHHSLGLVFPTRYEGFGLPAVEAMASGTAVFASNVSSLPEVVGEGGVLLPLDVVEPWVEALERAAKDEPWRVRLAARGKARAAQFTWERAAEETWQVFREAAGK
jgi:glycosyltransferase involved in cell wall biosynthesis